MKKLFTLLFSTITIFALVSCNDVDTSSTTSVVTPSSSIITPSSNSDTSSLETSSNTGAEEFFDESSSSNPVEESSSVEVSSSIIEESSSEETSSTIEQSSSDEQEPSSDIESSSSEEEQSSIIEESSSDESSSESSIQVTYHVRFVNYDDSLLYETDVNEGEQAIYLGETPIREDEGNSTFEFIKWDKDFSSISSDLVVKAKYREYAVDNEEGWGPIHWG